MFTHSIANLFSKSEAAEIIRLSEDGRQKRGGLVGGTRHDNIRRAEISWLDDQGTAAWVMDRIVDAVARANRDTFSFDITEFKERLQVAAYDETDEGHYDWHSDIGDGPIARYRKLTIVTQLSDPDTYEGGDLEISLGGTAKVSPRDLGSATLFASFMLHRVVPVTRGSRYSLTCWSHGPHFR
ncbi:2OG-Fe(II) oxygenase [Roseibium aggregatum]|uniref:2OG-Fe(II) oxygenase n=1 Tax=Roseibium aggregatum TaxID=187304 RepID=A0A926NY97_9HYPH|nr:2OG-Fe(II) oxygenase [Roseibium aggregatum]MBD1547559.1 2OG-Fe(II) oxygenase [Roseibium aggregatum]